MKYSKEYYQYLQSSRWAKKSTFCQRMTQHRCVLFPWLKSNVCHHLTYRNLKREVPVFDTVPLSHKAHHIVHWGILWNSPLRPLINAILRILMLWAMVIVLTKALFRFISTPFRKRRNSSYRIANGC